MMIGAVVVDGWTVIWYSEGPVRYGDGAVITVEENSSVFSLIQMR